MLQICRIKIENFVCLSEVVIEPSMDPEKPLTVIRAENGSGKTTLLRAIRWGMYGEPGLPGQDSRQFGVHPADWKPNDDGIKTSVSILFETDGSTRYHTGGRATNFQYELRRSVTTIAQRSAQQGVPDFRRIDERAVLQERKEDGSWSSESADHDKLIAELLPIELQDFFVMDADEATDYAGGSENKTISHRVVIEKTSAAISSLLGLEIFRSATKRIEKVRNDLERDATKAAGDKDLEEQQQKLDRDRKQLDELTTKISEIRKNQQDIDADYNRTEVERDEIIGTHSAHEQLRERLKENEQNRKRISDARRKEVGALSRELSSITLLSSLATKEITKVRDALQPLYNDGSIPMRHLDFVQKLLEDGVCVCGQDLLSHGPFRSKVQEVINVSREDERTANFLAQVLDAVGSLSRYQNGVEWNRRCEEHEKNIGALGEEADNAERIRREISAKLDSIDDEKLSNVRKKLATLGKQREQLGRDLSHNQKTVAELRESIQSLEGKIRDQRRKTSEAKRLDQYQNTASVLIEILENSYTNIRDQQVCDLGGEMKNLFLEMVDNIAEENISAGEMLRVSPRMIADVGLRAVKDSPEEFEIFALNYWGRSMPPTEINGAARRILALSFVLALCKVSRTNAPFIADSLLNVMSGSVRTNTLRVTANTASQPILLLTGSDLEANAEIEIVDRFAGATYTLTGKWHQDVLNQTTKELVSEICNCGPRQFCHKCERKGQADNPTLTRVENGERYE